MAAVLAGLLGSANHSIAAGQPDARELLLTTGERVVAGLKQAPLDQLVRWGVPAERPPQPTVVLRDGSTIVSGPAWSRGGAVRLTDDNWAVRNASLRSVEFPRRRVRAAWFNAAGEQPLGAAARAGSLAYQGAEDRVWLASGDVLSGRLDAIEEKSLVFTTAGEAIPIELTRVDAVSLGGPREAADPKLVVGLADGSLINARRVDQQESRWEIELADGQAITAKRDAQVVFLQGFGERVRYLSDLEPLDFQHTPYLSVDWPLGLDGGLDGGRLLADYRRFLKGLAMHSAARAVYRLEGDWRRFAAELAIEDRAAGGSVSFHVLVARDAGFEPAYDSPIIRTGDAPTRVSIDVGGARAIALLVDYADYADRGDHALWLDARLEK